MKKKVYKCIKCKKIFQQKSHYVHHTTIRVKPCVKPCIKKENLQPIPKKTTLFQCTECMNTFTRKDNLNRHVDRYCNGPIDEIQIDEIQKDDSVKPILKCDKYINDLEFHESDNAAPLPNKVCIINNVKRYVCKHCGKNYSRKDSLERHKKKACNSKKEDELKNIYEMLLQIKEENKQLKMQIDIDKNTNSNNYINTNNYNTTINNTINNTINIVAFGKEEITFTDEAIKCLLSKGFNAVELTVKNTNFSTKKPHFHNVYLPNIRGDFAMVYNGKKWGLKDLNYVLQQIYNDKKYYLEDKFDEFIDSLNKTTIKSFRRFLKKEENDPNCSKGIIKNIKAMMHNDKRIPINTKKHNDKIVIKN
jgi:DNA-directed RNA polymerase subunit RPC12/RpoP